MSSVFKKLKSRLTTPIASTSAGQVFSKGMQGAASILLARALAPDERGRIAVVISATILAAAVSSLGIDSSFRYYLPNADHPRHLRRAYAVLSSRISAVFGFIVFPLMVYGLTLIGTIEDWDEYLLTWGLFVASMLTVFGIGAIRAEGLIPAAAWIEAVRTTIQVVLFAGLFILGIQTIEPYMAVIMCGWIASWIPIAMLARKKYQEAAQTQHHSDIVRILRHGLVSHAGFVAMNVAYRIDRFILEALRSSREVGLYAVAGSLGELIAVVPTAIAQVTFDRVAKAEGSEQQVDRTRRLLILTVFVSVAGAAVAFPAIPWLVVFLFGSDYANAADPARVLLLAGVAMSVFRVAGSAALGRGEFRRYFLSSMVAAGVAVVGGIFAVNFAGMIGAAVVSVIAYALAFTAVGGLRILLTPSRG